MLQTINPKADAVNTAFLSGFGFMPGDLILEFAINVAITRSMLAVVVPAVIAQQ